MKKNLLESLECGHIMVSKIEIHTFTKSVEQNSVIFLK